jgi:hypothetical protein
MKSNENTKQILNQTEITMGQSFYNLLALPSIHLLSFLPFLNRLINCSDSFDDDLNVLQEFSNTLKNINKKN